MPGIGCHGWACRQRAIGGVSEGGALVVYPRASPWQELWHDVYCRTVLVEMISVTHTEKAVEQVGQSSILRRMALVGMVSSGSNAKELKTMAQASSIEWTESTWNPVTGCTKISPGCAHCYAQRMAKRLKAMGQTRYRNEFKVTLQADALETPLRWKRPRMIFVNSMSDLFHEDVPTEYIIECFSVMEKAAQHTFQVLTKRPERAAAMGDNLPWPKNVWMGTSVENADFTSRVHSLVETRSAIRFLSIEPLLGPIPRLPLRGIHWVIVGGESGPAARPMESKWVFQIRDRCVRRNVPFFFKQWGGVNKKKAGRLLDGQTWNGMPNISCELPEGDNSGRQSSNRVAG